MVDSPIPVILFFLGALAVFLVGLWFVNRARIFVNERKYLDREIMRSTGDMQEHYKKLKRKSWRIFLPFSRYPIH